MGKLHFPIVVEIDENGLYIISCPLFKGCRTCGETLEDAMKNISKFVEMCLEKKKIENLNTFVGYKEQKAAAYAKAVCE